MRTELLRILAVLVLPAAVAGCACGLEDAGEIASAARSERERGTSDRALKDLAKAGDCIRGDAERNFPARYLLASVYFNMHLLGAPSAFPADDKDCRWAVEALKESGEPDFLALAYSLMQTLEKQTFTVEGLPAWATVDRWLISADALRVRAERALAELPESATAGLPQGYGEAQLRLAVLEMVRGYCVQAWRRALETTESPEPSRGRLTGVYRSMADAWDRLAALASNPAARKTFEEEAERVRGLAERSAIVITPDDLGHAVDREMLKLEVEGNLREGRRGAMQGFDEKKSGNKARAVASLQRALAHFAMAFAVGEIEDLDRKSAIGYIRDVLQGLRDLER